MAQVFNKCFLYGVPQGSILGLSLFLTSSCVSLIIILTGPTEIDPKRHASSYPTDDNLVSIDRGAGRMDGGAGRFR